MPLCNITRTWIDKEIHEINVLIKERKAAAVAKQVERLAKRDQDNPEVIAKRFMFYFGIGEGEVFDSMI